MNRPNVLIIMSDQHNPHLMAHAGDAYVRTPGLDRLAESGVSFSNAYCAAPLCVPSRMAFMTGQYPTDLQIWTNGGILSNVPTFAHQLSLAGWETTLCGRMHFNGPDQHHGFERRLVGDVSGALRRLTSGLFEGVWAHAGCGQSYEGLCDNAVGPGQATYSAYDADVTARACAYIRSHPGGGEPFCLVVGLLLPHNPYVCPKALFEEYMDKLPAAERVGAFPEGEHPAVLSLRRFRGTDRITPDQARRARAAYYGLVTRMDENIGRIMDSLDEKGLTEETVVVYTSDHGELNGEHGLWWKDSFYEGSVGVPMIWSRPGHFRTNHCADAVVSLLDVGPTLSELVGAEPLPGARGRSLIPWLEIGSEVGDWPDTAFAETYARGQRPARMIRSGRWKLNAYHGYAHPQVFDVAADPDEANDLGAHPDYADVRDMLMSRVMTGWSGDWIERRVQQRLAEQDVLKRWAAEKQIRDSERWTMREGMNVRAPE